MINKYFSILLHYLESIYRKFLIKKNYNNFLFSSYKTITDNINTNSFHIQRNFLSTRNCKILKKSLDGLLKSKKKFQYKYWHDEHISDQRIWRFHKFNNLSNNIMNDEFINNIAKIITGRKKHSKIIMANKLTYKKNNYGSGGGWHRDSPYRSQFKAFLYLNNVGINNGPLQLLPKSHKPKFLNKMIKFNMHPGQYRFSNSLISNLLKNKIIKQTTICEKAGTLILANTKCIHRGVPLKLNNRYVLTIYFGDPKLPSSI